MFGRRDQPDEKNGHLGDQESCDNNNSNKAWNSSGRSRRSLLPASDALHLEVPCFAVKRPPAAVVIQAAECSSGRSDGRDRTNIHCRSTFSLPSPTTPAADSKKASSDAGALPGSGGGRGNELLNADNVSAQLLATITSRDAALTQTKQNIANNGSVPVSAGLGLGSSQYLVSNGFGWGSSSQSPVWNGGAGSRHTLAATSQQLSDGDQLTASAEASRRSVVINSKCICQC